jgi:hypothetical protein
MVILEMNLFDLNYFNLETGIIFYTYYFGNFEIQTFNLEENLVKSYMILKLNWY